MTDIPRAFPGGNPSRYDGRIADGMTLRDWFAGQVLTGLIAPSGRSDPGAFARDAYRIADAMLAERAK